MTDHDLERFLRACRDHLNAQAKVDENGNVIGVPADDMDDAGVVRAMTEVLGRAALTLTGVSMIPASWDKRFVRQMALVPAMPGPLGHYTVRQAANIARLRHKYRRQIPSPVPAWARAASTGDHR